MVVLNRLHETTYRSSVIKMEGFEFEKINFSFDLQKSDELVYH
jgi:hypothetical protein